jgi:hypothetical protein
MGRAHRRLLTWSEIEREHGVPRNTLKSWVHRGHLSHLATDRRTRAHLYLEADVLACQRDRESGDQAADLRAVA